MVGNKESEINQFDLYQMLPLTIHVAPGHWAGHMRIYHRMCLSLAASSYRVSLLAQENASDQLYAKKFEFHSLGRLGEDTLDWRLFDRFKRCKNAYNYCRKTPAKLIQFYSPEFIPWGIRLKQLTGLPVIFDCMEDFPGYVLHRRGIPNILRSPLSWVIRTYLAAASKHFDAIIVADEGTGKIFSSKAKRVVVIHNYPQKSLFPDPGENAEKSFDLVYHGSLPRYHLTEILHIDDALKSKGRLVTWRLIGRFTDKSWFLRNIREREASERFIISELIPHDQIAQEIQKARIGIIPLPDLPKFQNNIPQKLFEFMALRIPVVLSDLPPSRRYVMNENFSYKIQPGNHNAYADAIIKLLGNPNLRDEMGRNARIAFETGLNWESESEILLDLYKDLLA